MLRTVVPFPFSLLEAQWLPLLIPVIWNLVDLLEVSLTTLCPTTHTWVLNSHYCLH